MTDYMTDDFLTSLYVLSLEDAKLDHILDAFDDKMLEGDFAWCDRMLRDLDTNLCSVTTLVGFLSFTLCAKEKLQQRDRIVTETTLRAMKEGRTEEEAEQLLVGLR